MKSNLLAAATFRRGRVRSETCEAKIVAVDRCPNGRRLHPHTASEWPLSTHAGPNLSPEWLAVKPLKQRRHPRRLTVA